MSGRELFDLVKSRGAIEAKALIDNGADVNYQDARGDSVLHQGSARNNSEMVRLLVESKANVNARNKKYETPLMFAAKSSRIANVRALVECGAIINTQNYDNKTAIDYAKESNNGDIVEYLNEKSASPSGCCTIS